MSGITIMYHVSLQAPKITPSLWCNRLDHTPTGMWLTTNPFPIIRYGKGLNDNFEFCGHVYIYKVPNRILKACGLWRYDGATETYITEEYFHHILYLGQMAESKIQHIQDQQKKIPRTIINPTDPKYLLEKLTSIATSISDRRLIWSGLTHKQKEWLKTKGIKIK